MFFWIFVIVVFAALVALWRNDWDFSKAWGSLLALGAGIVGAVVAWFNGGGSTP